MSFADWRDCKARLQAWVEQEWACESEEVRRRLNHWVHEHGGWESTLRPRAICLNSFMVSAVCADVGEASKRYENRRSQYMGLALLHQSQESELGEWGPTVAQVCTFDPLRLAEEGLSALGGVARAVGWLEPYVGQQCPDPVVANVWRTFNTGSSDTIKHGSALRSLLSLCVCACVYFPFKPLCE